MRTSHGILAALTFALALAFAPVASADEADTLFDQGLAAYKQGHFEQALASYESAWKLRKTHDLAAAMAQVEMLLGRPRDAAEHLAYALRYFPVSGKKELRETLESALADATKKVTKVRLMVTGDAGAPVISVDGKPIDTTVTGSEIYLAPGTRTVEASAKGFKPARRTIEAKEGQSEEVTLALVPEDKGGERSMLPVAISFGVGGAGLIAGAVAGGVAIAQLGDLKKVCGDALVCPPSEHGHVDAANVSAGVSTAGFVLAGVGAAVGVTLLLLPPKTKTAATMGVHASPAFVGVKGTF